MAKAEAGTNPSEAIAREWHSQRSKALEVSTLLGIMMRLEKHLFPWLGKRPIAEIEAPEILAALRRAEGQELGETPKRLRQYCGQIFRYAIATGRASHDPAADLRGALRPHNELIPERAIYRVRLSPVATDAASRHFDLSLRGRLVIHGRWESPGWPYLRQAIAVVIRETGF